MLGRDKLDKNKKGHHKDDLFYWLIFYQFLILLGLVKPDIL